MQIVVKNNTVWATHPDHVTLPLGAYPGAEVFLVPDQEGRLSPGDRFDPKERPQASREAEARILRDKLLAASDWTQLVDAPLTESNVLQWRSYRQTLRDLDLQAEKIVWPTRPSGGGREEILFAF